MKTANAVLPIKFLSLILLATTACSSPQRAPEEVDEVAIQTPEQAKKALADGNSRFLMKRTISQDFSAQIQKTQDSQKPYAIVLSCLDSRIPPEIVLDQGIGDIFVARVAGNIENSDILGSMEFGTAVAGAKLIVVMGHTKCGAVKGACQGAKLEHLTDLLKKIEPSVQSVKASEPKFDPHSYAHIDRVAEENVTRTVSSIRKKSATLSSLEKAGKLKIVGAMYDLASGKVTWTD